MPVYESDLCEEYLPEVKPETPPEFNGGNVFMAWRLVRNQTQFVALPVVLHGDFISELFSRGTWRIVQIANRTQQQETATQVDGNTEVD
jgi:hypothetical protein